VAGYRKFSRNPGHEAAKKHIAAAREFTEELGGIDQDVKNYFFSLKPSELKKTMNDYGSIFGTEKQSYAEQTFEAWKTGRREMSGIVAQRLFSLLPPQMPLEKKYELVENLWKHLGPKSNKVLTVGYDVSPQTAVDAVANVMLHEVQAFTIPESMEKRFTWLAAGDVSVKQRLLNHLQELERHAIIAGTSLQLPSILQYLNSPNGLSTQAAAQEIRIGNHLVRLEFERGHSGITEGSVRSRRSNASSFESEGSWLVWLIGASVILSILYLFNR
jgi:hypothetical protein